MKSGRWTPLKIWVTQEHSNIRFKYTSKRLPVTPSMESAKGSTWMRLPYSTSAHWCTDTTSPRRTRKFALTTLFMRIFGSSQVSSAKTMHTVSFLFLPCRFPDNLSATFYKPCTLPSLFVQTSGIIWISLCMHMNQGKWEADTLMSTLSPRNNCNFSMVPILSATTELSSFTASSTIRRFGAFFRSKIAVEKSGIAAGGLLLRPERQLNQRQPVNLWPDNKHSSDNNILLPTDEHADKIETKTQHGTFPQKIHCQTTLGTMKHRKEIQKNSPIITSLHYAHKNSRKFFT